MATKICPNCGEELLLAEFWLGGHGPELIQFCPNTAYDLCDYQVRV